MFFLHDFLPSLIIPQVCPRSGRQFDQNYQQTKKQNNKKQKLNYHWAKGGFLITARKDKKKKQKKKKTVLVEKFKHFFTGMSFPFAGHNY